MISVDKIIKTEFKDSEDHIFCLCEWMNNLVLVPCEDAMSGYYPDYNKAVILVHDICFVNRTADGIIYNTTDETYTFVFDSHDGFHPHDEMSIDDLIDYVFELSKMLQYSERM